MMHGWQRPSDLANNGRKWHKSFTCLGNSLAGSECCSLVVVVVLSFGSLTLLCFANSREFSSELMLVRRVQVRVMSSEQRVVSCELRVTSYEWGREGERKERVAVMAAQVKLVATATAAVAELVPAIGASSLRRWLSREVCCNDGRSMLAKVLASLLQKTE